MPIYRVDYYVDGRPYEVRTDADCEACAVTKAQAFLASEGIDGRCFTATDVTEGIDGQLVVEAARLAKSTEDILRPLIRLRMENTGEPYQIAFAFVNRAWGNLMDANDAAHGRKRVGTKGGLAVVRAAEETD